MSDDIARTTRKGLTSRQQVAKRALDLCLAVPGFVVSFPLILLATLAATIDTNEWGIYSQPRIGRDGRPFRVRKIRSMKSSTLCTTTVTTRSDPRITTLGALLRRTKIDELPQLWNVVVGDMSLVGPRPDVQGWADELKGPDRIVLSVKPGITGPASIAFRNEEALLAEAVDPEHYNRYVIWPEKTKLNREYIENWSLRGDILLMLLTIRGQTNGAQ